MVKDDRDESILFDAGSHELLSAAGVDGGEVDAFVFGPAGPDLCQLAEHLIVFNRQLQSLVNSPIFKNPGDEVLGGDVCDLVLLLEDVGDLEGGGSRSSVLVLLVGEDVDSDDGGFGGAVLAGLGSGVFDHLAGETLEHAVATLLNAAGGRGHAV